MYRYSDLVKRMKPRHAHKKEKDCERGLSKTWTGLILVSIFTGLALISWRLFHENETVNVPLAQDEQLVVAGPNVLAVNRQNGAGAVRSQKFVVTPIQGHVTDLQVSLRSPDLWMESYPEGYVLRMEDAAGRAEWGVPDLPSLSKVVEGQDGLEAQVDIVDAVFRDFEGLEIAALLWTSLGVGLDGSTLQTTARLRNEGLYSTDAFWPSDPVTVEEGKQREKNLVRLGFNPVQYNPVTKTVRYYETLDVRLRFVPQVDETLDVQTASSPLPPVDPCACPAWTRDTVVPESPNGVASEFAVRRSGAEVDAIYRCTVSEEGLYRIRASAMTDAGVPTASLIGSQIRLFCGDSEVALWTNTSGPMDADDWILFYADGVDGIASGDNVYWLGFGGTGNRMTSLSGAPFMDANVVDTHCKTVTYGPDLAFNNIVIPHNPEFDHWFSHELLRLKSGLNNNLMTTIATDFPVPGEDATLCFRAVGVTVSNHNTRVSVGGSVAATFSWFQDPILHRKGSPFVGSATFSSSLLSSSTVLKVEQNVPTGQIADQVFLDAVRIIYPRELKAAGDVVSFTGQAGRNDYHVTELSDASEIWVLDISNPTEPKQLIDFSVTSTASDGFQVAFGADEAETPSYYVAHSSSIVDLTTIEKTPFRDLGSVDNEADWIVITPDAYRDSVYPLTTSRHIDGHRVVVAPISDVYNEFSYGVKDPDAIRQFLGYAYHHWQKPSPTYVLIAGKGTYDPREYLLSTPALPVTKSVIPTHMGSTSEEFTGLDTWFCLVSGSDNLADMSIGRVPVNSDSQMQSVVSKILAYDNVAASHPSRKKGTLVAGRPKNIGDNFTVSADVLAGMMTAHGFSTSQKLYDCDCNSALLSAIHGGRFFVSYYGHGAAHLWDKPSAAGAKNLLHADDVSTLTNTFWPIISVFTCQNGFYVSPYRECLAERLLERPSHGAIAVVAPTAFSQTILSDEVSEGFYSALIQDKVPLLGDALLAGQLELWSTFGNSPTELMMYQIFGDPALIVNPDE